MGDFLHPILKMIAYPLHFQLCPCKLPAAVEFLELWNGKLLKKGHPCLLNATVFCPILMSSCDIQTYQFQFSIIFHRSHNVNRARLVL
ncbi:Uncharacterized protein APZ42_020676 [Daphnia magna]|uniref:Uncharacterized protein n=1 Tax=Daphnia magna TaxID=35525 RepID=A0A0P5YZ43_9CRUS|nr:Uncharacterized protein APZ42_020676 [Daphnia magna]